MFQEKAWCDEKVMKEWITQQWIPASEGQMLLIIDVHRAQKTENIIQMFKKCQTDVEYVPPGMQHAIRVIVQSIHCAGATFLVQPLDVSVNAPFKKLVEDQATKHLQDNLESYISGKVGNWVFGLPITDSNFLL